MFDKSNDHWDTLPEQLKQVKIRYQLNLWPKETLEPQEIYDIMTLQ